MTILQHYLEATRCVEKEWNSVPLHLVDGFLPPDLNGTLFRNGNGRFEHQGVVYKHLFDGDGMINAFRFDGKNVYYSNRYVRTREFLEEEQAGQMRYRSFGTNLPGGFWRNALRMRFKNAANTNIIHHGGRLLALWEGGLPHEIDPLSLETLGRFDYDGALQNRFSQIDRLIFPELAFSAHPKIHPQTGTLYNFGTVPGMVQRLLTFEVDPAGKAHIRQVIPMEEVFFTHDFVLLADGRQIFFITPVAFDMAKAFLGLAPPVEAIRRRPTEQTRVLVTDGRQVEEYRADYGFIFHFTNGYADEEGNLVVDAVALPDFPTNFDMRRAFSGTTDQAPVGFLTRYTLDPSLRRVRRELLSEYSVELPSINRNFTGFAYRYVWAIGDDPRLKRPLVHGWLRVDLEERQTKFMDIYPQLPGEPIFVPRSHSRAEDDGWLLAMSFHPVEERSYLNVLDAATLRMQARLLMPHNTPLGFHGCWVGNSDPDE